VVGVAAGPEVAVVALTPATALWAVVAVLPGEAAGPVLAGRLAPVVEVVSGLAGAVEAVVLLGAPAMANWPPRRNDGGPLWVSL